MNTMLFPNVILRMSVCPEGPPLPVVNHSEVPQEDLSCFSGMITELLILQDVGHKQLTI